MSPDWLLSCDTRADTQADAPVPATKRPRRRDSTQPCGSVGGQEALDVLARLTSAARRGVDTRGTGGDNVSRGATTGGAAGLSVGHLLAEFTQLSESQLQVGYGREAAALHV